MYYTSKFNLTDLCRL